MHTRLDTGPGAEAARVGAGCAAGWYFRLAVKVCCTMSCWGAGAGARAKAVGAGAGADAKTGVGAGESVSAGAGADAVGQGCACRHCVWHFPSCAQASTVSGCPLASMTCCEIIC